MKLALVMLFAQGELPFLQLHLPVYVHTFDGIVALTDPKCTDGSVDYMQSLGAHIVVAEWRYNWGDFATRVVNEAERLGYDAVCRIDPDECLMPDAAGLIRQKLEHEAALLVLPRHEFFGDRRHVRPEIYPDGQARAWRTGRGITVEGRRHEGVWFSHHGLSEDALDADHRVLRPTEPDIHLFHYGWLGKTGIRRNQYKYQSHAQVTAGGPPEVNFPPDLPLAHFDTVPFDDPQPIAPDLCGLYAPWTE